MPPTVTTLFIACIILFLTASNVWAIESYSEKFGIECKGCHTTIPNLNERGVTFKKNGHTVVEKSLRPDTKPVQSSTENKGKPLPVIPAPEIEQPLKENKIYLWESGDGTTHLSDTPYEITPDKKIAATDARKKKAKQSAAKLLSAKRPKRSQNSAVKSVTSQPEKRVKNYEKCMEEILISYPAPITAEIAMDQFKDAENICLPHEKRH